MDSSSQSPDIFSNRVVFDTMRARVNSFKSMLDSIVALQDTDYGSFTQQDLSNLLASMADLCQSCDAIFDLVKGDSNVDTG